MSKLLDWKFYERNDELILNERHHKISAVTYSTITNTNCLVIFY